MKEAVGSGVCWVEQNVSRLWRAAKWKTFQGRGRVWGRSEVVRWGLTMMVLVLVEGKEGEQERNWRAMDEDAGEKILRVGRERGSVERAENIGS